MRSAAGSTARPILQHQVSWVHPSLLHWLISERMRNSFVQLADVPLDLSGTQVTRDLGLSGTSDPLDLKGDEQVLPTASRYPVHPMPASSAWMILAKLPPEHYCYLTQTLYSSPNLCTSRTCTLDSGHVLGTSPGCPSSCSQTEATSSCSLRQLPVC